MHSKLLWIGELAESQKCKLSVYIQNSIQRIAAKLLIVYVLLFRCVCVCLCMVVVVVAVLVSQWKRRLPGWLSEL